MPPRRAHCSVLLLLLASIRTVLAYAPLASSPTLTQSRAAAFRRVPHHHVRANEDAAASAAAPAACTLPPDSFLKLVTDAAASTDAAIAAGQLLCEVEFPPLPTSKLDDSSLSAYDILALNLQFVLQYVKALGVDPETGAPRNIALTLPDSAERARALKYFGDDEPWPNTKLWSLNGGDEAAADFGLLGGLMAGFGSAFKQGSGAVRPAPWASMHIIVGASCQELPAIQRIAELEPTKPIVCFNLKLDVQRGDLGLPAFPPSSVHEEFLCRIKPVYYMRPRSYSLSLSVPPFLIAYSGVLFRRYPEEWQTLLDRGQGSYRRVTSSGDRPNLGTFKSQLTAALKLADDKAAASAISQAGFKQSTWWEDNKQGRDVSTAWKE